MTVLPQVEVVFHGSGAHRNIASICNDGIDTHEDGKVALMARQTTCMRLWTLREYIQSHPYSTITPPEKTAYLLLVIFLLITHAPDIARHRHRDGQIIYTCSDATYGLH